MLSIIVSSSINRCCKSNLLWAVALGYYGMSLRDAKPSRLHRERPLKLFLDPSNNSLIPAITVHHFLDSDLHDISLPSIFTTHHPSAQKHP